ncbi:FadR/GntR family transcriptional regulator [Candidimonas nitroreducens]|uniref:GntR family transcriptional regulator n=1 Tax=Candidimonas nitroreducens TaxID=683354 RepID=A0A225MHL5_9BURK|nr:FadR/GntR family transcriptional regulator [Candidimonas nitroreducens]OWT60382.1 GntR family transcriptional regulator [Candidimonas nitroreducens]
MFTSFERPDNLPDAIAQQIRLKILAGDFEQGAKLPTEYELSEIFKVSRNVVREAIARLKLNGLIETRRGIGSFVSQNARARRFEVLAEDLLDIGQLRQIYQLRIEIESGAAALAAENRTETQLLALEDALVRADESKGDWERGVEVAIKFHLAVTQCSNNFYFIRLMEHLSYVIHKAVRTLRYSSTGTERIGRVEYEHHAVVDAIRLQDAEQARQAMRMHLSNGMARYSCMQENTKNK